MAFSDGDPFVSGSLYSFQQGNRMIQNYRGATVPSNLQAGALWSDSDDDKLYHEGAAAGEEIMQLTRSSDVSPKFTKVYLSGGVLKEAPHKTTGSWAVSIGSGGDYADWATMIAAMPDMIAHAITITIKAGTTLTEICDIRNKHGLTSAATIDVIAEKYFPESGAIPTADSATATTLRDAALATAAKGDDYFNGCWVFVVDGTGTDNGYVLITDYVDATGDVVVASWPGTQPDNTSRYIIVGAMVDGEGTRDNGFLIQDSTVALNVTGVGVDDADDYGIYCFRTLNVVFFRYCGAYDCGYSGLYARNSRSATFTYGGLVKNNTKNNGADGGAQIGSGSFCSLYLSGISDNLQQGVRAGGGAYANYMANNFGDLNGDWGIYAINSAQANITGTECSGVSGNHSDPGTAGDNNADQASAY